MQKLYALLFVIAGLTCNSMQARWWWQSKDGERRERVSKHHTSKHKRTRNRTQGRGPGTNHQRRAQHHVSRYEQQETE